MLPGASLRLEDSQVEEAERLFKLAALGLLASTPIIQLVDARDGSARPATDVIDGGLIEPAAAIGASERQKNPTLRARSPGCPGSSLDLMELLLQTPGP
jgi:hypothetical protein